MQRDSVAQSFSPALLKSRMLSMCRGEPAPDAASCSVCTASVEKRIRTEQACRLHERVLDSLSRFQDWLRAAELWAASPASSQVPFAVAKEELKKFEVLQRQIQEKLHHLESLNRQYRQLVQANGISLQGWLRAAVQESNQRWDNLQKRAAAILKRLKYFVSQREEFEWERETVQVWLTELDLRLTDVEHFSGGSSLEKMMELQEFQEAVLSNAERLDWLLVSGERLIQRSEPQDAEILEEELQELSCYCQEVFWRVFRFRRRLVSMRLVFEDEWLSDRDTDVGSDCFTDVSLEPEGEARGPPPAAWIYQSTPRKALCCRRRHPFGDACGGSLDLEWDPSVDVGGSTSHDEEDSSYCSAITGVGQWEEPGRRCSCQLGMPASWPAGCGRGTSHEDLNGMPLSGAAGIPRACHWGMRPAARERRWALTPSGLRAGWARPAWSRTSQKRCSPARGVRLVPALRMWPSSLRRALGFLRSTSSGPQDPGQNKEAAVLCSWAAPAPPPPGRHLPSLPR
ncbi:nesprin-4 isoform X4 [Chelonoidis abingdonii]|uniref:nesprin-4 isoform X4 n=1 Tax=Chelonoidis abingdonii TaxID=106734 RepID=UPI0013F1FE9E|nr:nesprin-4 isoform X4 [Chelonoidis abingdonii]